MTRILRRFNYTQRIKIPQSKIYVDTMKGENGASEAIVREIGLEDCGQHPRDAWEAAEVFLEARRTTTESFARLQLGTVASLQKGGLPKTVCLEGFGDDFGITFRIKVVDEFSRLLADGDDIRPGEPKDKDKEPLIYLVPMDLGEELWQVDFEGVEGPRVFVNERLTNSSALLTRDPFVRGLIVPQIVRAVLPKLLEATQKSDDWVRKWSEFLKHLGAVDMSDVDADSEDDTRKWIDDVVSRFSNKMRFASHAESHLQRTTEQ